MIARLWTALRGRFCFWAVRRPGVSSSVVEYCWSLDSVSSQSDAEKPTVTIHTWLYVLAHARLSSQSLKMPWCFLEGDRG